MILLPFSKIKLIKPTKINLITAKLKPLSEIIDLLKSNKNIYQGPILNSFIIKQHQPDIQLFSISNPNNPFFTVIMYIKIASMIDVNQIYK